MLPRLQRQTAWAAGAAAKGPPPRRRRRLQRADTVVQIFVRLRPAIQPCCRGLPLPAPALDLFPGFVGSTFSCCLDLGLHPLPILPPTRLLHHPAPSQPASPRRLLPPSLQRAAGS